MNTWESRLPVQPESFSRPQRTSLLLEATALAHGLDTLRMGSRGFVAGEAPHFVDVGFQDTLSLETSRAAVRSTADRLTRRALLQQARVSLPDSRRFGHKQVEEAVEYSQQFPRGILVKPSSLDVGSVNTNPLRDPEQVRTKIDAWQSVTGNHATYLVERHMRSREYIFYVVNNAVVSVAALQARKWGKELYRAGPQGFGEIHDDVIDLALRAFRAMPAMPHGEVRITCPTAPLRAKRCRVVSVRPRITLSGKPQPDEFSAHIAHHIITHATRNLPQSEALRDSLTVDVVMNEVGEPGGLADAVSAWIGQRDITGSVETAQRKVVATITGTPGQLVTLSGLARTSRFSSGTPQSITLHHQRGDQ